MPFAPQVRKQVLQALDEHIIPALQAVPVVQILAAPPFDFSTVEHHVEQQKLLPHKTFSPLQISLRWPREHMVAIQMPCFGFVYEGVSQERVGVTTAMGTKSRAAQPAGITRVHIPAPGIICYPPFAVHSDGHESNPVDPRLTRVFCFRLTENDVRVMIAERDTRHVTVTHHLQIGDALLAQLGAIYLDELQQAGSAQSSQAQLLAFMTRLRRYVYEEKPGFSNSCWPDLTDTTDKIAASGDTRHQALCREVVDYIQRNLHLPLRLDEIAKRFEISRFHLNCIFRQVLGTTVMHYVTQQRIEVAREIIERSPEPVHDIAQLTGFASTSSFCTVFRKHTGFTPNEYRQEVQRKMRKSAK